MSSTDPSISESDIINNIFNNNNNGTPLAETSTISSLTQNACNLAIIKFKNYYIYLHNIGVISAQIIIKLRTLFKGAEQLFIVPRLLQISVNNNVEVIHLLPNETNESTENDLW